MDSSPRPYQPVVPFYHIAIYKDCHTTRGVTSNFETGPTRTPRKSRRSTPYPTPTLLGTSLARSRHSSPSSASNSEEGSDSDSQSGKHTVSFDINDDDESDDGPNDPELSSGHAVSADGPSTTRNQSVPRQIAFKEPVRKVVSVVEQVDDGLVPKPPGEVGRPSRGGYNLRDALGWDKDEYKLVMKFVNQAVVDHLNIELPMKQQSPSALQKVRDIVVKKYPTLNTFRDLWVVDDFIRSHLKYKRVAKRTEKWGQIAAEKGKETAKEVALEKESAKDAGLEKPTTRNRK